MTAVAVTIGVDPREARPRIYRVGAEVTRRVCAIPEDITVTDWSARERVLPETSASPGPYDPSVVPYARRWQDLGVDPSVTRMALCWAAQTTKSTVIENIIAYRIVHMPSPMVIVQPKIDAAEGWAKERFVPMVRSTPALRSRVRIGRSTDSTLRYKAFPGGFIFVASAQSAAELASRSASFVGSDEVDRMEPIPGEGNPVEIVDQRQGSSDIGLHIMTSTPRHADSTIIWPYLETGTFELYHVACPHCGQMQPLFWCNLKWEPGQPGGAHYVCGGAGEIPGRETSPVLEAYLNSPIAAKNDQGYLIGCGAVIDERAKPDMLAGGEWRAMNPTADYPSSHLHGLYSPFAKSSWGTLAKQFERALGKPADLQVVVNTRFAETWSERGEVLKADALAQRVEPLVDGIVPDGVGAITIGGDVQVNRVELDVWGWGAGLESWLIATIICGGDPAAEPSQPGSVWALVAEALERTFKHVSGRDVPVAAALIDSGYQATKVYRFTHRRRARKVFAAKGVGGEGLAILGKPSLQGRDRTLVYPIGVDAAKTEFLKSQLFEDTVGPGFVHIPDWMSTDQIEQFVSEERKRRVHRGQIIREWRLKKPDARNERLDCRNYARAALELLGAKAIANLGDRAIELSAPLIVSSGDENETLDGEPKVAPRPKKRGGWMKGFK